MVPKKLYISFENQEYRANKASLLSCKADIIQLQKKLVNLHALRSHKKRLLANLAHLTASTNFIAERLEEKMPENEIPPEIKSKLLPKKVVEKKIRQKMPEPKPIEEEVTEDYDVSNLDKELMELNRRIKELG